MITKTDKTAPIGPLYDRLSMAYIDGAIRTRPDRPFRVARTNTLKKDLKIFRRSFGGLPRVDWILKTVGTYNPSTIIDIGSGDGATLFPLIETFRNIKITGVEKSHHKVDTLNLLRDNGVEQISGGHCIDIEVDGLSAFKDRSFSLAVISEVLEHLVDPGKIAMEAIRVTDGPVLVTVPSHKDNNASHINLFTRESLRDLFPGKTVEVDWVPGKEIKGHLVAVIT